MSKVILQSVCMPYTHTLTHTCWCMCYSQYTHTHTSVIHNHTHTHTHTHTVVVRPWESGMRCMVECSLKFGLPSNRLHTHTHAHFNSLFIEKIPKHPEFPKAAPTDKARIKKLLKQAFPRAMELKDKLRAQFEKEKKELENAIAEEVSTLFYV